MSSDRFLFFFLVVGKICIASSQEILTDVTLPNWIDQEREVKRTKPVTRAFAPPNGTIAADLRFPAEWEPAQAVFISYKGIQTYRMLKDITAVVTQEGGAQVWGIKMPKIQSPMVDKSKLVGIDCPNDSVWTRDYGPIGLTTTQDGGELAIIDAIYRHYEYRVNDDNVPQCLAQKAGGLTTYQMPLILDGGNVMVDGTGNFFHTSITYKWNSDKTRDEVDDLLKAYFNVDTIHTVDYAGYPGSPLDNTGHLDMFVKLLDVETVMIATTSSSGFQKACEGALSYFENITAPTGNPYKIIQVEAWASKVGGVWYTYTNSLIVNGVVLVPSYKGKLCLEDSEIAPAYEAGIPGIKVRFINSDDLIKFGGAVHCVTQLLPALPGSSVPTSGQNGEPLYYFLRKLKQTARQGVLKTLWYYTTVLLGFGGKTC